MCRSPASTWAFFLFLMVNVTLFLRPGDVFKSLEGLPIYEGLILGAFALSIDRMRGHFAPWALRQQPITLCVVGLFVAVILSQLTHMYLSGAKDSGIFFLKTLIYYALLVTVVDTPRRLRWFALTIAVVAPLMVSLCVVDYLNWHDFEFIKHVSDRDGIDVTGKDMRVWRMRGIGIFQDPNDISLVIVASGVLCAYFVTDKTLKGLRLAWLVPMAILTVGLLLTRSRGGLLTAGGAGMALLLCRFGGRTAFVGALAGLCLLPFIAGRQADISIGDGTGHARIELWREGLAEIRSADILFGIGEGMYADVAGLVAHNSYVHAYVELGLVGGTFYFGCFFFAALALYRQKDLNLELEDEQFKRFHPYLVAMLVGWCTGMLSLSRCYVVPTYMILGLSAAYINLAGMHANPRCLLVSWDRKHLFRLASASAMLFVAINVFVRVFAG